MNNALIAVLALPVLVFAWVGVQTLARRQAARHPECGPYHEAGGGCGGCSSSACTQRADSPDSFPESS